MPRPGEAHHKATLCDEVVRFMRALRERHGWSYGVIANYTGASPNTVRDIVTYRTRMTSGPLTRADYDRAKFANEEMRQARLSVRLIGMRYPHILEVHN